MAHDVNFSVPLRPLGSSDVVFVINRDSGRFGMLRISKGSLVWYPKNGKKGRKVSWDKFDEFMLEQPSKESRKRQS